MCGGTAPGAVIVETVGLDEAPGTDEELLEPATPAGAFAARLIYHADPSATPSTARMIRKGKSRFM